MLYGAQDPSVGGRASRARLNVQSRARQSKCVGLALPGKQLRAAGFFGMSWLRGGVSVTENINGILRNINEFLWNSLVFPGCSARAGNANGFHRNSLNSIEIHWHLGALGKSMDSIGIHSYSYGIQ